MALNIHKNISKILVINFFEFFSDPKIWKISILAIFGQFRMVQNVFLNEYLDFEEIFQFWFFSGDSLFQKKGAIGRAGKKSQACKHATRSFLRLSRSFCPKIFRLKSFG